MKFFVIGSNSFSGAHFIRYLLLNNHEIIGVSRSKEIDPIFLPYLWNIQEKNKLHLKKLKIFQVDINKHIKFLMELLDNFRPDFVVNFAAQGMVAESWLNPTHWYKTNLLSQVAFHDELRKRTYLKKL